MGSRLEERFCDILHRGLGRPVLLQIWPACRLRYLSNHRMCEAVSGRAPLHVLSLGLLPVLALKFRTLRLLTSRRASLYRVWSRSTQFCARNTCSLCLR